jgi:hypothetical protein
LPKRESRIAVIVAVCLLTAIMAGITIWSIDGSIKTTHREGDEYSSWSETDTFRVDPVGQGILAFFTIGLSFISIALIINFYVDDLKGNISK